MIGKREKLKKQEKRSRKFRNKVKKLCKGWGLKETQRYENVKRSEHRSVSNPACESYKRLHTYLFIRGYFSDFQDWIVTHTARCTVLLEACLKWWGEHWGVLKTAMSQKNSVNLAITQKNCQIPQYFNTDGTWCHTMMSYQRFIQYTVVMKNLLMNIKWGSLDNIHCTWMLSKLK